MVVASATVDGAAVLVLGLSRADRISLDRGDVLTVERIVALPFAEVARLIIFGGETDASMQAEMAALVDADTVLED